MKKIVLLLLALVSAFIVAEFILSLIIGFPKYGVELKVIGTGGSNINWNIYYPHSKYWTVEGGNKVFKRNNLGFPGSDVAAGKNIKFIFVLGSSYIEAYQVPPEQIAVSVFNARLARNYPNYQALNLGVSGNDPYNLYFRAKYFENKFSPKMAILVLDNLSEKWLTRHKHPLQFDSNPFLINRLSKFNLKSIPRFVINKNSFFNLLIQALKITSTDDEKKGVEDSALLETSALTDIQNCLSEFKNRYESRFVCISIIGKPTINEKLENFCLNNQINFISRELNIPKYKMVDGRGHLSQVGNKLLGDLLYEAFDKYI